MVMVLEVQMVEEIATIGRLRAPTEACGLLLPFPLGGRSVWEVPNRSKTPHDSFHMRGQDMAIILENLFPDGEVPEEVLGGLTAWHTHPSGNVGPSWFDLHNKPANIRSLVVSLDPMGVPTPTWY
jgi:proteasome lid subunit RPN8/RPN11